MTSYLFRIAGPSSVKFRDGRGGFMAAMVAYSFIHTAAILDFFFCLPISILAAIFKFARRLGKRSGQSPK